MHHKIVKRLWIAVVAVRAVQSFHVLSSLSARSQSTHLIALRSSIGDDDNIPPSNPSGENRQGWDDFLNRNENESDNLIRAREYISDNSLPISYGREKIDVESENEGDTSNLSASKTNSSAMVANGIQPTPFAGGITQETLQRNPYLAVVTKLSPSEIISKFTATAHPGVQNAVRSTILGLIGGLPKMAFETTTVTTGQRLASLMFQLQMTGYMFKVSNLNYDFADHETEPLTS
jgi:hypothetical protein